MAVPSFLNRDNIAAALQGLATGLIGYGSGNPNAGLLAINAVGNEKDRRLQNSRLQALMDRQASQDAYELQKRQEEAKRRQAASDALKGIVSGQPGMPNNGRPGGMGTPARPPAMTFDPAQSAIIQAMNEYDPESALALAGKQAFEKPDKPEAPVIKDFLEGGLTVQKQWDPATGQWAEVGRGGRWQPQQPKDPTEQWVSYTDPLSNRTGQKSLRTGKIDWDPGNTILVQTGTDDKGQPIWEMQSATQKKPSDKPATESEQKSAQLYTRASQQLPILEQTWPALTDWQDQAAKSMLPDAANNFMTSENYQRAYNAVYDIAASYIYSVSGAQAPETEVRRTVNSVMPKFGEKPEAVADKKRRIDEMVQSIKLKTKPGTFGTDKNPNEMTDEELLQELNK